VFFSRPDLRSRVVLLVFGLSLATGAARATVPNPMRPPLALSSRAPSASVWKLEAILRSHGQKLAIINDRPVHAGAVIAGARVLRIGRTSVVLRRGRRILVLHVFPVTSAFRPLAPGAAVR
jgi:hypothetical protein